MTTHNHNHNHTHNKTSTSHQAKSCVKLTHFDMTKSTHSKYPKPILENHPIKIVINKLDANGQIRQQIVQKHISDGLFLHQSTHNPEHQTQIHQPQHQKLYPNHFYQSNHFYQQFTKEPQHSNQPSPYIFEKYNYENYQNYEFRNPLKPQKKAIDKIIELQSKKLCRNDQKNLEIVYCENKFQDFVQICNNKFMKMEDEQTKLKLSQLHQRIANVNTKANLNTNNPHPNKISSSEQKNYEGQLSLRSFKKSDHNKDQEKQSKKHLFAKAVKTTLSNYLQEFNTLEKLSVFFEKQQKLNQRQLYGCDETLMNHSKTVLLDLVTHRFAFLQHLKRKVRQKIYKCWLKIDKITVFTKINIHQYMAFARIFIGRDASTQEISNFLFKFIFFNGVLTEESALAAFEQISCPSSKMAQIHEFIHKIFQFEKKNDEQQQSLETILFTRIHEDRGLQNAMINLILNN